MDSLFEERICRTFFDKRCSDRLCYELSSRKKRRGFLDRMCHNSKDHLADCVYKSVERPFDKADITDFLGKGECYCISLQPEADGIYADASGLLDRLWSNGMPYLIVNAACTAAYLETEYDFSEHRSYLLRASAV